MAQPKPGDPAPDFTLPTDQGTVTLSTLRGAPVVLYFYPKDDTEGCTIESIEFTGLRDEFAALGVRVIGISPDTVADHEKFRAKHGLGIELAADPDRTAIDAYGVWGEKTTFGKTYTGLIRTTFLVAADGTIAQVWPVLKIKGHAEQVLAAARDSAG